LRNPANKQTNKHSGGDTNERIIMRTYRRNIECETTFLV